MDNIDFGTISTERINKTVGMVRLDCKSAAVCVSTLDAGLLAECIAVHSTDIFSCRITLAYGDATILSGVFTHQREHAACCTSKAESNSEGQVSALYS